MSGVFKKAITASQAMPKQPMAPAGGGQTMRKGGPLPMDRAGGSQVSQGMSRTPVRMGGSGKGGGARGGGKLGRVAGRIGGGSGKGGGGQVRTFRPHPPGWTGRPPGFGPMKPGGIAGQGDAGPGMVWAPGPDGPVRAPKPPPGAAY